MCDSMNPQAVQERVCQNTEQIHQFSRNLSDWEKQMKLRETRLTEQSAEFEQNDIPPVRGVIQESNKIHYNAALVHDTKQNQPLPNGDEYETEISIKRAKRDEAFYEKEQGNECVKNQRWTEAIYHYSNAIECFQEDATFYCNRALCYLRVKKWKEAETDATIAVQLDPTYVKAYHRRALALVELDQLEEAREDLEKALKYEQANQKIQKDLQTLLNRISNGPTNDDRKKEVNKLIENKKNALIEKEKGNECVKKGQWESAIRCYTLAISLFPNDASFYLNRALCYLKNNEPKKTIIDCVRVLEFEPNNVKAYYRRGLARKQLGLLSDAHADFLKAFELEPTNKVVQRDLKELELSLGFVNKETVKNKPETERVSKPKGEQRITGERFVKLGATFVEPRPIPVLEKPKEVPSYEVKIADRVNMDAYQRALKEGKKSKQSEFIRRALRALVSVKPEDDDDSRVVDAAISAPSDEHKPQEKIVPIVVEDRSNELLKEEVLTNNVPKFELPTSFVQFSTHWKSYKDSYARYLYLKLVTGSRFQSLFREALESDMFGEIVSTLVKEFVPRQESVFEYIRGLSEVKRIGALMLFASEHDLANIKDVIKFCEDSKNIPATELDIVKKNLLLFSGKVLKWAQ